MKILNRLYKICKGLTISISLIFISSSSFIYLYNQRGSIISYLYPTYKNDNKIDITDKDIEFAEKIMEGGFILHFRHAEEINGLMYKCMILWRVIYIIMG